MKKIFVNLKRFEVKKEKGGICPMDNSVEWANWVMEESIRLGIGKMEDVFVGYFLPESLLSPAISKLNTYSNSDRKGLEIGCQSVFREDIEKGGNFGAFTSNRIATAMKELGCSWTMIAHSEERKDKLQILSEYDPEIGKDELASERAYATVDSLLNSQVKCAMNEDLKVVFCIGETAEQKGYDEYEKYAPRVKSVLESQLKRGLKDLNYKEAKEIVIAYEPVWAIGPGKTPPNSDYISFVSKYIKEVTKEMFGIALDVVYGGGLKEENAQSIAKIDTIDGGLVALTKFEDPIGFDPQSLKNIILAYIK